jgi:Protein of unknown function (DUF4197)
MRRVYFFSLVLACIFYSSTRMAEAGFLDKLESSLNKLTTTNTPSTTNVATTNASTSTAHTNQADLTGLSEDQVVLGIKQALSNGVQQAVSQLGHQDGFLTNATVKIPMPDKLQTVEKTLRNLKQDKLADNFITTMNRAAELAVPEAANVFGDALKQMNIDDAKNILLGSNDAATQYFSRVSQTNLYAKFYPIVKKATEEAGVTSAYKQMLAKTTGTTSKSLGSFGSFVNNTLLSPDATDIDAYVTNKTIEGLFKKMAEQEKLIRQNPAARATDVLQKVFGAVKPAA